MRYTSPQTSQNHHLPHRLPTTHHLMTWMSGDRHGNPHCGRPPGPPGHFDHGSGSPQAGPSQLPHSTVGRLNPAVFPGVDDPRHGGYYYDDSRGTSNMTYLHPSTSAGPTQPNSPPNIETHLPRGSPHPRLPRGPRPALPHPAPTRPTLPYDLHSLGVVFSDENTDDIDDTHFMLKRSIDPSKFTHLFHINPMLSVTNANYPL